MGEGEEVDEEIKKMDAGLHSVFTVLQGMGLKRVADTFVGDQQTVRGVSGGEKKRVTVAEMAVATFPVACADEISTGLDGKFCLDFFSDEKMIKIFTLCLDSCNHI
jgi:ABC-type multidrug transport system ATPase subunit